MSQLRTSHNFLLSSDSTETTTLFERVQRADELTSAFANGSSRSFALAASSSVVVNTAPLTNIQFLYVQSDIEVQVTLNGSATPIRVFPRSNASLPSTNLPARLYLWTEGVTLISLSNPSSTQAANVVIGFAGV